MSLGIEKTLITDSKNAEEKKKDEDEDKNEKSKNSKTIGEFIFKFLEDRVGDPLWRSFAFFFILYNWQAFIALIFGKFDNPDDRIKLVSKFFEENDLPFFMRFINSKIEIFTNIFIVGFIILLIIVFVIIKNIKSIKNSSNVIEKIQSKPKYFWNIIKGDLVSFLILYFSLIILNEFDNVRFITIPLIESLIFIFIYMRYIKPSVIKIYESNNSLSIEAVQAELKEKNKEIERIIKDKVAVKEIGDRQYRSLFKECEILRKILNQNGIIKGQIDVVINGKEEKIINGYEKFRLPKDLYDSDGNKIVDQTSLYLSNQKVYNSEVYYDYDSKQNMIYIWRNVNKNIKDNYDTLNDILINHIGNKYLDYKVMSIKTLKDRRFRGEIDEIFYDGITSIPYKVIYLFSLYDQTDFSKREYALGRSTNEKEDRINLEKSCEIKADERKEMREKNMTDNKVTLATPKNFSKPVTKYRLEYVDDVQIHMSKGFSFESLISTRSHF